MVILLPKMIEPQAGAWAGVLDVFAELPTGWCLVGGQMVQLHCAERGVAPIRPTDDVDAVLDVRARPHILREFTSVLARIGFAPAGESWEGHQQRWLRNGAAIDVLIPRYVGAVAAGRRGVFGGTTLETPGAQSVLDAAEVVEVAANDRTGSVLRPRLAAAIVAKSSAFGVSSDRYRRRHLVDVVLLSTLLTRADSLSRDLDLKGYRRVSRALRAIAADPSTMSSIPNAEYGLRRLAVALTTTRFSRERGGSEAPPPFLD